MLKLFGAFFILGGCGYMGMRVANIYGKRPEFLRTLLSGLSLLETEINYSSTPLPLALKRVGEKLSKEGQLLFLGAAQVLEQKKCRKASEAWQIGIDSLRQEIPLTRDEINILTLFGHGLGGSDKEEQLKNLKLTREQLRLSIQKAEEAKEKNQRMWQYMGFCLGAVIVLVLI